MTKHREDGFSIAKLTNRYKDVVGWVIMWDNFELSVLWLSDKRDGLEIDPPLSVSTIESAKAVTTDEITELLEKLSELSTK